MKSNLESSPVEASACPPDAPDPQSDALVRQFRAYLHQVISAEPTRPGKPSTALPGPTILSYARALAGLPDHPLARELSRPLVAILDQMTRLADFYEGMLLRTDAPSAAWRAAARQVLDQVDFAHAQVLHTQLHPLRRRGRVTANLEFLGCAIELAIGQGADAARLIRRYQKLNPEPPREADGSPSPGSLPEEFARDAGRRVAALESLGDDFPGELRHAAREMPAWPVLLSRSGRPRRQFLALAQHLELGRDYPTDTSADAHSGSDTPLAKYLDPLIYRLHVACGEIEGLEFKSLREEQHWLYLTWWTWPEDRPSAEVLAVIHAAQELPPLTKATAAQWAGVALVPLILATDARDHTQCTEPALQAIARQRAARSPAGFKRRLLSAVTATVRRLARPE
jgi:hypothetical protein